MTRARTLLLMAAACGLSGCIARTEVRRLQPGVYDIVRIDCGFPTDTGLVERLRADIERIADARCAHGYDLGELQASLDGMRGSAVTGECPNTAVHAVARCRPARGASDSLSPL